MEKNEKSFTGSICSKMSIIDARILRRRRFGGIEKILNWLNYEKQYFNNEHKAFNNNRFLIM